jgi:hypothetical protein
LKDPPSKGCQPLLQFFAAKALSLRYCPAHIRA